MSNTDINRILVAEDNPQDQAMYKRFLSEEFGDNIEMIFVETGQAALTFLSANTVDCILLDFKLSDMDGLEFLRKLSATTGNYPVLMLTGCGNEKVAVKALKLGVYDYIIKEDLDPRLLRNAVLYAVEKFALAKQVKEKETKMEHMAYHDHLTSIPNRLYFEHAVAKSLAQAKRYNKIFSVILLDLDKFKMINDTRGHEIGDELLKQVAQRFQTALRGGDVLARSGGDEFFILLDEINKIEDARMVAKKIVQLMAEPFIIQQENFFVTASIGIALYHSDGVTIPDLLRAADRAMYQAKNTGGNKFHLDH